MKRAALLGLTVMVVACGGDGSGPEAPGITSRQPAPGAQDVSVAAPIRITFAGAVTLPADTASAIRIEQGGALVPVEVKRLDARTLELTPRDVLEPGAEHTVLVGAQLTGELEASWAFTTAGRPVASLAAARLLAHVTALAHDSMAGRGSGTPDEVRAATYIRNEFSRHGLKAFSGDFWFQPFTLLNVASSQNVVGVLRGEGTLRDEWVIVGAHYDHVGVRGGVIHNGADDNASGTAGMLEIARALVLHEGADGFGSADRRSIMFIAFGMEELGLIGSYFYCQNPLVPLSRLAAMLNLDMIGRLRSNSLYVIGEDTGQEWSDLLRRYEPSLTYQALADAGTDHRCFRQNGRPVMSLFTGLHADYHQPSDDPATLDVAGLQTVANLALELAVNLAVRPRPLTR